MIDAAADGRGRGQVPELPHRGLHRRPLARPTSTSRRARRWSSRSTRCSSAASCSRPAPRRAARHCEQRGVVFSHARPATTACGIWSQLGMPLLKNGSDYLVHLPLIARDGRAPACRRRSRPGWRRSPRSTTRSRPSARPAAAAGPAALHFVATRHRPRTCTCASSRCWPRRSAARSASAITRGHRGRARRGRARRVLDREALHRLDRDLPGPDHAVWRRRAELRALADGVRACRSEPRRRRDRLDATEAAGPSRRPALLRRGATCPPSRACARNDIAAKRPGHGMVPKGKRRWSGASVRRQRRSRADAVTLEDREARLFETPSRAR